MLNSGGLALGHGVGVEIACLRFYFSEVHTAVLVTRKLLQSSHVVYPSLIENARFKCSRVKTSDINLIINDLVIQFIGVVVLYSSVFQVKSECEDREG
jgi:hypothetical protein